MYLARFGALAILALTAACGDAHVDAISRTQPASTKAGATTGPWAKCQFETGVDMPTICPDKDKSGNALDCAASRVGMTYEDGSTSCDLEAVCNYPCSADADCPAPQSGSSTPYCDFAVCRLRCSPNEVCPDGMNCWNDTNTSPDSTPSYCMWKYDCHL